MSTSTETLEPSLPDLSRLDDFDPTRSYLILRGSIPQEARQRWQTLERHGRGDLAKAVEAVRSLAITGNPLGLKIQQLVHFGQLLVFERREGALTHAKAALRAGATTRDLVGVAETALITSGVSGYNLGLSIVAELEKAAEPVRR